MSYNIYCHVNIVNGKRYIGLTKQPVLKRWHSHVYAALNLRGRSCRYVFPMAIRKYGKSGFTHETLEVCDTLESANAAEQKWIAHFRTTERAFGYNMETGGGASGPRSPEVRAKISAALKAHYSVPENHMKLSHVMPEGMHVGRKLSQEHKDKVRVSLQSHYSDPTKREHLKRIGARPRKESDQ